MYVARILNGVRSVVIPIIVSACLRMKETALKGRSAVVIVLISVVVCTFTKINKIIVILTALAAGILIWRGEIPDDIS